MIATYDNPDTWRKKRWIPATVEEAVVPDVLRAAEATTVAVLGCGSGRELGYLTEQGFTVAGCDISSRLVEECRSRYPTVPVVVSAVHRAPGRMAPADAVVTSAVLAHIPPEEIGSAIKAVDALARTVVVLHEKTAIRETTSTQWVHDYVALMRGWSLTLQIVTDDIDAFTATLMVFRRNGSDEGREAGPVFPPP